MVSNEEAAQYYSAAMAAVRNLRRRYGISNEHWVIEELKSAAGLALLKALSEYQEGKGAKKLTFVMFCAERAAFVTLRKYRLVGAPPRQHPTTWPNKQPLSLAPASDTFDIPDKHKTPEQLAQVKEFWELVRRQLTAAEWGLVKGVYLEGLPVNAAAQRDGICYRTAREYLAHALHVLRRAPVIAAA